MIFRLRTDWLTVVITSCWAARHAHGRKRTTYRYYLQAIEPFPANDIERLRKKAFLIGRRPAWIRGGLVRRLGGWQAVKVIQRRGQCANGDERILNK